MKLAIISTHPIQYYAPWFRHLAAQEDLRAKVFYLWDFGVTEQLDRGFGVSVRWDVPLLDGYDYEFVKNTSRRPGTHHFQGLQNPALMRRVAEFKPDGVLLMAYNYASLYQFLWGWDKKGAPLLLRGDSHRLVPRSGPKEQLRRRFIKYIFSRFSAFLYVGKANRHYYLYHGVPADRLSFSPHAVDNDAFTSSAEEAERASRDWRRKLGIPEEHSVILFAGKFEEKKRPLDLLAAFSRAQPERTTLLFVGAGAQENEIRARARSNPNVRFAPFQNQSQMARTYTAGDLFVLPSQGPSETWGLAINEAMCMGRPVIVSDHVGCAQDLVVPRRNGLIFPAGDVAALSDCLLEALSDPVRLRDWGGASREIIAGYNYQQTTDGLKEALAKVRPATASAAFVDVPGHRSGIVL